MSARRSPLPRTLSASFTGVEARAAAVGWRRLQYPDVLRVVRGIYARASSTSDATSAQLYPDSPWHADQHRRARFLAPHLRRGRFFCGHTAACLWRLPVPARADTRLEVGCHAPDRGPRGVEFVARRFSPTQVIVGERYGAPTADPASIWAQLAPQLEVVQAIILGDAIIHEARFPGSTRLRRTPVATIDQLTAVAYTPRRARGAALRALLPRLSPHAASPQESRLRVQLAEWGFPEPALDYDVYDEAGALAGCSEIAYPEFRLAVEYEGTHHRVSAPQWNRDIEKYRRYTQLGWEVIRVTATLLGPDRATLRETVHEALTRRGWTGELT